jgi:dTMP kinase
MPRGAFIVLEGLDRSGKTTQVDRLVARLQKEGREVRLQKFPGEENKNRTRE